MRSVCGVLQTFLFHAERSEQTSKGVISKTLEVRFKAQAANSNVAGNIIHDGRGINHKRGLECTVKMALPFTDMSTEECIMVGFTRRKCCS
jgi:hypothetical protein